MTNAKPVNIVLNCDVFEGLKQVESDSVDCIITSPPYWGLRDYGVRGQIGLEPTLQEFINNLLKVTLELKRVLKPSGVLWWNHGDCYSSQHTGGSHSKNSCIKSNGFQEAQSHRQPDGKKKWPPKCLVMQNYRLIMRMIDEQGWILRNVVVWHKSNAMPSSVKDRLANSYEPVFMLVKKQKYYFDLDAIRVPHKRDWTNCGGNLAEKGVHKLNDGFKDISNRKPVVPNPSGKNPGDVWKISTKPFSGAHFATFPPTLVEPMIKAACPRDGVVLDPFAGAGTTLKVAQDLGRGWIGIELNPEYVKLIKKRLHLNEQLKELSK